MLNSLNKKIKLLLIVVSLFTAACGSSTTDPLEFDGGRAFKDLEYQVNLGPRVLGSKAHEQVREWIIHKNKGSRWNVEVQTAIINGQDIYNIVAAREMDQNLPWVIIGAHYDSRMFADRDPMFENRTHPVPGANDGASGVSVLLELARILPTNLGANVWLVYFDAEDNGNLPGGEWILGSRVFVESLEGEPDAVVIVDMIGDSDLNIFMEKNSDQNLSQEIWEIAADLGYENQFIAAPKHRIIDDHLPFVQAGIQAVDIIDFDYPYWHTVADNVDKVSAVSLNIVGEVLLAWVIERYGYSP
jgi:Zn-dependent M28 family amino/carboxypeptidase